MNEIQVSECQCRSVKFMTAFEKKFFTRQSRAGESNSGHNAHGAQKHNYFYRSSSSYSQKAVPFSISKSIPISSLDINLTTVVSKRCSSNKSRASREDTSFQKLFCATWCLFMKSSSVTKKLIVKSIKVKYIWNSRRCFRPLSFGSHSSFGVAVIVLNRRRDGSKWK
jgi:hypothetical protein